MSSQIVKEASKIVQKQDRSILSTRNFILNTEYGRLAILRPMIVKKYLNMSNSIIRDVTYVNDNTSTNFCNSIIKRKTDYFLFKPESHYGNNLILFKSIRSKVYTDYFGTERRPENPFRNCKTPDQIFNLSRNIKLEIKMKLSRFGFVLLRNGEVSTIHKEGSILLNNANIQEIMRGFIKHHEVMLLNNPSIHNSEDNKFSKYDYFLSAEMYEGIISANNYIQKGITVSALGDRKVYTNYGVFNPTRQDYLSLFDSYLREHVRDIKLETKNCIDLGCGTGVLSLILSQYEIPRIFAVDKSDNSVIAAKSNTQAFGYFDNIKVVKMDITEKYGLLGSIPNKNSHNKKESKSNTEDKDLLQQNKHFELLKDFKIDSQLDLVVCNPPWLNANLVFSQTDLENAIYDPDHQFLRACFNFAKIHLNRANPKARLVLIFSDLGNLLNLNNPEIIEKLALEFKFKITFQKSRMSDLKTSDNNDPLKNFKKESKVLLYELQRI